MNVYKNLFDLTQQNLTDAGGGLDCNSDSFCAAIATEPISVDLCRAEKLSGKEYLDSVWLSFFQKLPPEELKKEYSQKDNAVILQRAVNEPAFAIRRLRLCNSPHNVKKGLRSRFYAGAATVKNSVLLRKIAKKMPKGIQNKIRGMYS
ncbi:MAG: hypothetical protein ACI4C0_08490 [Lachnospiraceae bacterium]